MISMNILSLLPRVSVLLVCYFIVIEYQTTHLSVHLSIHLSIIPFFYSSIHSSIYSFIQGYSTNAGGKGIQQEDKNKESP